MRWVYFEQIMVKSSQFEQNWVLFFRNWYTNGWVNVWNWFMQPSMGTLNSPSSRVVKDSTPSRRRILRCINFGIGESLPNLFLNVVNPYLVKFEARWILNERPFYCFIILFIWKWILTLVEKIDQLGESSPNFIFAAVNLDPNVIEKRWTDEESWPNDFAEKVNRGEDLMWVGSRCPLTRALEKQGRHANPRKMLAKVPPPGRQKAHLASLTSQSCVSGGW